MTADKIDASNIGDLSDYDVLYIDKSVVETGGFNASAVEEYVSNGGSVFLDNDVYNVFDLSLIHIFQYGGNYDAFEFCGKIT